VYDEEDELVNPDDQVVRDIYDTYTKEQRGIYLFRIFISCIYSSEPLLIGLYHKAVESALNIMVKKNAFENSPLDPSITSLYPPPPKVDEYSNQNQPESIVSSSPEANPNADAVVPPSSSPSSSPSLSENPPVVTSSDSAPIPPSSESPSSLSIVPPSGSPSSSPTIPSDSTVPNPNSPSSSPGITSSTSIPSSTPSIPVFVADPDDPYASRPLPFLIGFSFLILCFIIIVCLINNY
jgi:hypothetical protein